MFSWTIPLLFRQWKTELLLLSGALLFRLFCLFSPTQPKMISLRVQLASSLAPGFSPYLTSFSTHTHPHKNAKTSLCSCWFLIFQNKPMYSAGTADWLSLCEGQRLTFSPRELTHMRRSSQQSTILRHNSVIVFCSARFASNRSVAAVVADRHRHSEFRFN